MDRFADNVCVEVHLTQIPVIKTHKAYANRTVYIHYQPYKPRSSRMQSLRLEISSALFPSSLSPPRNRLSSPFFLTNSLLGNVFPRKFFSLRQSRRQAKNFVVKSGLIGENPEWAESDYVAVGLAHCFREVNEKLVDYFVIEPIPSASVESMFKGAATSYKCIVGSILGEVLQQDVGLLPEELRGGVFAQNFDYRTKAAARTWKKQYAQENLLQLAPIGVVKKDFNFSLEEKRILGVVFEVKDEDNIKQDLSIDVYGRKKKEGKGDEAAVVSSLYNA